MREEEAINKRRGRTKKTDIKIWTRTQFEPVINKSIDQSINQSIFTISRI